MYYELYIDLFFLENFMMDSIILFSAARVTGYGKGWNRVLLGAAAGSLLTCLTVAIPMAPALRIILYHVVINNVMLKISMKLKNAGSFIRAAAVFYASAVVFGGIMYLFRPYMRYAGVFYAVAAAAGVLMRFLWKTAAGVLRQGMKLISVTLYIHGRKSTVQALWDTGNQLIDGLTGDPVSLMDPALIEQTGIMPEEERGFRMIPYRCAAGDKVMRVFRIDKMCIHGKQERWVVNPLMGAGEHTLSVDKRYEVILNPELFHQ